MKRLILIVVGLLTTVPAFAQARDGKTIEGFWQDSARRILFARNAPPAYAYGGWTILDPQQTYPSAKQIRRSGSTFELLDLLYDKEEIIQVLAASEDRIDFTRTSTWTGCSMRHKCTLQSDELFCALENTCREQGREVLDWRGEERYVRRANCERTDARQAQGIPVRCQ
ncbi:MAG TPA: hypothetical protein VGR01_06805 [Burkholderiales bacterium]|jgi:hypothetical protein|nr:hypothetical protein [Burkholderiales bacterium]HEV8645263.1 hypothetical protein [Burkholderiales bacterium]